jgi:hypothetical protein
MLEIGGRGSYIAGMGKVSVALAGSTEHRITEDGGRGTVRIGPKRSGAMHTVRFGDVEVTGPMPTEEEVRRNVELGSEGLRRALKKLLTPGIRLRARKDVPLFWVDPDNAALFIRELNGRRDKGVLENGEFKVTG